MHHLSVAHNNALLGGAREALAWRALQSEKRSRASAKEQAQLSSVSHRRHASQGCVRAAGRACRCCCDRAHRLSQPSRYACMGSHCRTGSLECCVAISPQKHARGADRSPTTFCGRRAYADGRRRSRYDRRHGHVSAVYDLVSNARAANAMAQPWKQSRCCAGLLHVGVFFLVVVHITTSLQKLVTGADRSPTVFAGRRNVRRRSASVRRSPCLATKTLQKLVAPPTDRRQCRPIAARTPTVAVQSAPRTCFCSATPAIGDARVMRSRTWRK